MKPLLKVMLILGALFALTFVAGRLFGILTVENVRHWLELAAQIDPIWLSVVVIGLLFLDLFVAVPTLTVTLLAGYFLGFGMGAAMALTGMALAAFTGFAIARRWGERPIAYLVRDPAERQTMAETFQRSGPAMIALSRAAPMVPEVTACMAGATGMAFPRYVLWFAVSTVPYVIFAAWAGSISTVENPRPAIFATLALYGILWTGWFFFRRRTKQKAMG